MLGGWTQQIFYLQEYIEKPGRDIRVFVLGGEARCAIFRRSEHWVTNTARGAVVENCPLDAELRAIAERAAAAIDGPLLAVDLAEDADGRRLVLEVNHSMEFRNSIEPTGVDIAEEIVSAALAEEVLSC